MPAEVKRKIEEAFRRNAEVDAQHITVEASDGELGAEGIRPHLGRAPGGATGGLVCPGRDQGRQPDHDRDLGTGSDGNSVA